MFEKRWAPVAIQLLTSDGTIDGQLNIADAWMLRVGQTILLKATALPTLLVKVKSVLNKTTFLVGVMDYDLDTPIDVSAYKISNSASISNPDPNQIRAKIAPEDFQRAVYEEAPAVALRTVVVNRGGDFIGSDPDSPFYVQLTDGSVNIGTVNAQLEMFITHKDNDPDAGGVHSSIRIGDGVDELQINPDGSLPVSLVAASSTFTYNEITSLQASLPTTVVSYTAPIGKQTYLQKIFVSGDNIATYKVKLNGVTIETIRTYFGGDLNAIADFSNDTSGKLLVENDIIIIEVEHQRPFTANFNGRVQSLEADIV